MSRTLNRKALIALGALIVALAGFAGFMYVTDRPSLGGSVIDPPLPAADIRLIDSTGQPFDLTAVRGNVTLLFFGYTNCPDECPLTLANLKLTMELLGSDARRTRVLLVTTDPARDTPDALSDLLRRFDPAFVGLTGTRAQLVSVWKDYGVTVMDDGETHSNYVYVIDPSGHLVETLLPDAPPGEIAADVRVLLDQD